MEELIVKYIAKHSSVGMFDGIEKQTTPTSGLCLNSKMVPKCLKTKREKLQMHFKLFLPHTR